MLQDKVSTGLALGFTLGTVAISVFQICQHLRNYTEPSFQRYIIRIIFLVPCYSVASCLALHYRHNSIYYETPRDCYEAWVIYNFMSLCMAYIGGPGAVVVKCEGKVIQPSWVLMTCCMAPIPVDGFFLRRCKQGTLQFVIAKPILAILTLILFLTGDFHVSNWSWEDGYPYITLIYNICYAVALFWLLLLYVGTDELLKPYKPMLKFACFKAVIFLTFWQSLVISFLATRLNMGYEDAEALQNWIIVAEMFLAAIGMIFAFPWSEYQIGGATKGMTWESFVHSVSISDVISDIMHMFNPSYGTYVLYHDGGPEKNVKKKRFMGGGSKNTQKEESTFSAAASAMTTTVRKPKRNTRYAYDPEEANGDEEGAAWYGGESEQKGLIGRVTNVFGMAGDRIQETGNQIIAIIPRITEQERNQATLVDSDSDAEYDEDNIRDNQVGNELLATSDEDDDSDHYAPVPGNTTGLTHRLSGPPGVDSGAPLVDSTSRVEAAFAPAAKPAPQPATDSLARVEMAFAEAFGASPVSPAAKEAPQPLSPLQPTTSASPGAVGPQPASEGSEAFPEAFAERTGSAPLGAPVVPLLPPPTRSPQPRRTSTAAEAPAVGSQSEGQALPDREGLPVQEQASHQDANGDLPAQGGSSREVQAGSAAEPAHAASADASEPAVHSEPAAEKPPEPGVGA